MRKILLLFCLLLITGCSSQEISVPDFCQGDTRYGALPNKGESYCGPAAVSNVLVYLDKTSYPKLVKEDSNSLETQFELIKQLGSKEYMDTTGKGTEPINLMRGLTKYIQQKGYIPSVEWRGWTTGDEFTVGQIPTTEWIKQKLSLAYNVVLQVGWYKYDPKRDFYKRISGHYVTLVKHEGANEFVFHDPSIRSGIKPHSEHCSFIPISSGTLSMWDKYAERSASRYLKVDGIKLKEGTNAAVVDGAVAFRVY